MKVLPFNLRFFKRIVYKTMAGCGENKYSSWERSYPESVSTTMLEEWNKIQSEIRRNIITEDTEDWQLSDNKLSGLCRVAGIDISTASKDHDASECEAFAAIVICKFPTMEIVHKETQQIHIPVPYVPGYLAFRESGPVVNLLKKILAENPDKTPDVLLVDGNGLLHPYKCGLACHIGTSISIPTIGVAKNLHLVEGIGVTKQDLQGMSAIGDCVVLRDKEGVILGMALKTAKDAKNPMYISIGHKISLDTAKTVVLKCCKYRIPEPIRFADNISRELVRKEGNHSQTDT